MCQAALRFLRRRIPAAAVPTPVRNGQTFIPISRLLSGRRLRVQMESGGPKEKKGRTASIE